MNMKNLSTKTKIIIGAGVLLAIFIALLLIFAGASSGNKTLPEEDLKAHITGITCQYDGGSDIDYDMSILMNDTQFDNKIVSRNYKKLKINTADDFKTLGLGFAIKPDLTVNDFEIKLMKNDEELAKDTFSLETDKIKTVDLHLETSVEITTSDEFYITIYQSNGYPFLIDTFLFFFDEV